LIQQQPVARDLRTVTAATRLCHHKNARPQARE
jgi:hypothetical protein